MVSISTWKDLNLASYYHLICRRNLCSASSTNTLVEEEEDLKSWMHKNGLPPCKVLLKEKPSLLTRSIVLYIT
ncbi:hypothetical protein CMV_010548 [Castanea mollissima]|uniref:Uncharacterized protein n=1 Tax=Castanea mollissima TaxID=60419 RepID=A0A8J4RCH3_9ROSI|nr:hypothetical protein CMV_010548 [Castanea mollissima]